MRATRLDVKYFAEGYRIGEVPLPIPVTETSLKLEAEGKLLTSSQRRKRRRMYRRLQYGYIPGYAPLSVDSNDPLTVKSGVIQRVLRVPPTRDQRLMRQFKKFVKRWLRNNLTPVPVMSFHQWIETNNTYNTKRKQQLIDVYNSMSGKRPTLYESGHVDSFVKTECYPEFKYPRLINSRCDKFKVFAGPIFKTIENEVYKLPQFIKHIPIPDRAQLIADLKKAGMHYYNTDFTAFECHFTKEFLLECECALYEYMLQYSDDAKFITTVLTGTNRARTRTGIRVNVQSRRMSGEMCTSLGNGFTNLMLFEYIRYVKNGFKIPPVPVSGFVEGDDGIFASDVVVTKEDYEKLGFTIKINEVDDPRKASFCGMIFLTPGQVIKEPRKVFMSFGWTHSMICAGRKIMDGLLRAKALSGVYEIGNCPILGVLFREALKRTRDVAPIFIKDGYHFYPDEIPLTKFEPTMETRVLFQEIYGVSVDTQLLCERMILEDRLDEIATIIAPTDHQLMYATNYVIPT